MTQNIQLENVSWTLREILQNIGDQLSSVVTLKDNAGLDVVVISQNEWQHLLTLLEKRQVDGYRIEDELPAEILQEVSDTQGESYGESGISLEEMAILNPEQDYELEAEEVKESDDILD